MNNLFLLKRDTEKIKALISEKQHKLKEYNLGLGDAMSRSGSYPSSTPEYAAIFLKIQNVEQSIEHLKEVISRYDVKDALIESNEIGLYSKVAARDLDGNLFYYYFQIPDLEEYLPAGYLLVSPESLIGKSLIGKKAGQKVVLELPMGTKELEIIEVKTVG